MLTVYPWAFSFVIQAVQSLDFRQKDSRILFCDRSKGEALQTPSL